MMVSLKSFFATDTGAVTVDWVFLTAAIMGVSLAVVASLLSGINSLDTTISTTLSNAAVATMGTLGVN